MNLTRVPQLTSAYHILTITTQTRQDRFESLVVRGHSHRSSPEHANRLDDCPHQRCLIQSYRCSEQERNSSTISRDRSTIRQPLAPKLSHSCPSVLLSSMGYPDRSSPSYRSAKKVCTGQHRVIAWDVCQPLTPSTFRCLLAILVHQ